jgi:hypothetical protein
VAIGALAAAAIVAIVVALYWGPPSPPGESAGGLTAARRSEVAQPGPPSRLRAGLARDEAIRAGADRLAPALFTAALQKAQEGNRAQDRGDAAAAQARYGEAIETFDRARDAAIRSDLRARGTDKAGAVQRGAPETGQPAEAGATGQGGSPPSSSAVSTSPRTPQNVERARTTMGAARRAAEKVAAGFFAHRRFASAQEKEREGLAALDRSEYTEATRLFAEAQSEYQISVPEAVQEAERERQLAPARASLEQAHEAVDARRREALAADAERLARDVFDQAQARQVEGDGLAGRQDLGAAAQAYRDAAERYGEAIRRARAAR